MRKPLAALALFVSCASAQQQEPLQKVDPQYSEEARLAGLEGSVLVTGTIGNDGSIRDLSVSRPLGLGLDEQAIAAAARWQFPASLEQSRRVTISIDFTLPTKQSRWHLAGAEFEAPEGTSRPTFAAADYPFGPGIGIAAYDEARILAAIGRAASATVSFAVDARGYPQQFQVVDASAAPWGAEAVMVVQNWRFHPGMKAGMPVSVPCTLSLLWGPEDFNSKAIADQLTQIYPPSAEPKPQPQTKPLADSAIVSKTEPDYTQEARQVGVEGNVWLSLKVDEQGAPSSVKVDAMDEPLLGLGLEENAIEAVKQWSFQPLLLNGQPTVARLAVRIDFKLSGVESFLMREAAPKPKSEKRPLLPIK
jgi:TonB family protein